MATHLRFPKLVLALCQLSTDLSHLLLQRRQLSSCCLLLRLLHVLLSVSSRPLRPLPGCHCLQERLGHGGCGLGHRSILLHPGLLLCLPLLVLQLLVTYLPYLPQLPVCQLHLLLALLLLLLRISQALLSSAELALQISDLLLVGRSCLHSVVQPAGSSQRAVHLT